MSADNLDNAKVDYAITLTKGIAGATPVVGSLIAEIVGNVIPNQRIDRIARFLDALSRRIAALEEQFLKDRMLQAPVVDILEDAFSQAARATTEERIGYIAAVVSFGISAEQLKDAETKRMLWLLAQLNNVEVILLRSRLALTNEDFQADAEWRGKHEAVLRVRTPHLGSARAEVEEATLHGSYTRHLMDLVLIQPHFSPLRPGEIPEFDGQTGRLKANFSEVSLIGRMLLKYLDLVPPWCRR